MKQWKRFGLAAALTACMGMTGACAISAVGAEELTDIPAETEAEKDADEVISKLENFDKDYTIPEIVKMAMPAMVAITNTSVQEVQNYFSGDPFDFFGFGDFYGFGDYGFGNWGGRNQQPQTRETTSSGTGVIFEDNDDYILIATNEHVVSDATTLSVAFVDDEVSPAELVGSDPTHDLAVIKVMKDDIPDETFDQIGYIEFGSSGDLSVGESVVAIGNALGYGQSVSSGIVSALNRPIVTQDYYTGKVDKTEGMIQTDASINPGNSGGALLNMRGELVGINSAKYADTMVEGMGYAIPSDLAVPIIEDIKDGTLDNVPEEPETKASENDGSVKLGVTVTTITDELKQSYGIPVNGVYVLSIEENGAAAKAGVQEGDIITALGDKEISAVEDLVAELKNYAPGDSTSLRITRHGTGSFGDSGYETGTVTVTFGDAKLSA